MKKFITLLTLVLTLVIAPLSANDYIVETSIPSSRQLPIFVDDADLVSDELENNIASMLTEVSEKYGCEPSIVTVQSLDGDDIVSFADDFYDYNGYGYGVYDDGLMLVIAMDESSWYITTHGYGITAFTDYGIEQLGESIVPYLSNGDFYGAFVEYASECDRYLEAARNGQPIDIYYDYADIEITPASIIAPSVIFAFIVSLIVTGVMRSSHKTVRPNGSAESYAVNGSFNLSANHDSFLYRNVTKTARPKDTGSSGGGSSTHRSSSGRSHGGGGGRF